MNQSWNERYATDTYIYGTLPNVWFKDNLSVMPPGNLLLPAEGEGRNAVFAASKGWNVTASDYSEVAKNKAMLLAEQNQVQINYILGNFSDVLLSTERYDCIAFIYAHVPYPERVSVTSHLVAHLKPGGTIIFEGFSKSQVAYQKEQNSGGPKDVNLLFSKQELEQTFKELTITYLEEVEVDLAEGDFHRGKASVIRMLAFKY
ncbi:class I SAM-dependent methyltransferase [Dyadobacter psychrotolerans]|uniref:Class I SAM-dependent methyltransferase n=1 Tax=Dyadobacter psychrotolerans TaxID=2541721 RepID=A0A4R5D906_9BACT|nr:class I SAM-dependent methyltransferase [Dyadobacter psychrotolerans]TDE09217.1 class I SAM-dependent methyltransferase [Dyadobacter psychrotolerans]